MRNRFWLITFAGLILLTSGKTSAELFIGGDREHTVDLAHLQSGALDGVKRAAEQGLCSPEIYEAGVELRDLIFYKTNEKYNSGFASEVWNRNQGLQNYFNSQMLDYPEMSDDKAALSDRLHALDTHYPVNKKGNHGPSLESTSQYNAYEEALKITKGNVFRAVTLVGSIGHDDVGNFQSGSNLFAPNSIGVPVPTDVLQKFKEAGERCVAVYGNHQRECDGNGSSFNYHVNFGFFLGCYFARKGFSTATASKLFADAAAVAYRDPYLEKELSAKAKTGNFLNKQYEFDVCSDVPKLLGYFYKKTTMARWLIPEARMLYEKGYNQPFLERDGKNPIVKPEGWSVDQWKKAIANLDYRLVHLEYGSKQSAAGAKRGAELCSQYATEIKPAGLSTDAELLYKHGNLTPSRKVNELTRIPNSFKTAPDRLARAWQELSTALRAVTPKLDYTDLTPGTNDPDRKIQHVIGMQSDAGFHTSLFSSEGLVGFKTLDEIQRLEKLDEPIKQMTANDLFSYLERKAARTILTPESEADADRHAKMFYWAIKKYPELGARALNYLQDGPSDFLKCVIFSAMSTSHGDPLARAARNLLPNSKEPLLHKLMYFLYTKGSSDDETAELALNRLVDVSPDNILNAAAYVLNALPYRSGEKARAIKIIVPKYDQLSAFDQGKLLRILFEQSPNDSEVIRLALPYLKSDDVEQIKLALKVLQANPSVVKPLTEDLVRIRDKADPNTAPLASAILQEN